MVNWLFSFHGRINRAQYWLGCVVVGLCGFALASVLALAAGRTFAAELKLEGGGAPANGLFGLLLLPFLAALCWAGLALQVKRFHDRGRTGWLAALPLGVVVLIVATLGGAAASGANLLAVMGSAWLLVLALWGINLWFFIDLGCLGSKGPNKHGDPPGGGFRLAPASPDGGTQAHALGAAQAAFDRAIAAQTPAPETPQAAGRAAPAGASFGRRATR